MQAGGNAGHALDIGATLVRLTIHCVCVVFVLLSKNYFLLIMLLQLSQFFPFGPTPPSPLPWLPRAVPAPLVTSVGPADKFFVFSISYTVLYIPMAIP